MFLTRIRSFNMRQKVVDEEGGAESDGSDEGAEGEGSGEEE